MSLSLRATPEVLQSSLTTRILHLILLPTEACNFRCTYCYEDFRLGRMEPWVVRGVKQLLTARAGGLDRLDLSWFGGEPLLARDLVLEVLEHAQALARAYPGLSVGSDITTNAWFLDRGLFQQLLALGVTRYQISFDGPQELHDRKRVRAGGQPTFERVWRNVLALREVPGAFEIRVRIHVDRANCAALPPFLDQCTEAFGEDPRFVLFLRPLSRFGGPDDAALPVFESAAEEERELARLRRHLGERERESDASLVADGVCYAARGNSFLVRADGRLGKCTVALRHPKNDIGRIHEDGTLEIDAARAWPWMRGLASGDPRAARRLGRVPVRITAERLSRCAFSAYSPLVTQARNAGAKSAAFLSPTPLSARNSSGERGFFDEKERVAQAELGDQAKPYQVRQVRKVLVRYKLGVSHGE